MPLFNTVLLSTYYVPRLITTYGSRKALAELWSLSYRHPNTRNISEAFVGLMALVSSLETTCEETEPFEFSSDLTPKLNKQRNKWGVGPSTIWALTSQSPFSLKDCKVLG